MYTEHGFAMSHFPPRLTALLLLALCVLLPVRFAHAAATCSVSSAGLGFGTYDPVGVNSIAADTTSGSLVVDCGSSGQGFQVFVSLSTGSSNNFAARAMTLGASALSYNIFKDANHLFVFGDGSSGTSMATLCFAGQGNDGSNSSGNSDPCNGGGLPTGTPVSIPMYGLLPAGQDVAPGQYSDTITATLTF